MSRPHSPIGLATLATAILIQPAQAQPVRPVRSECQIVIIEARITRHQLRQLLWIAPPQSTSAMRRMLGLPYCFIGPVEYFPLREDETTWIGLEYDRRGRYRGYLFSVNN